MRFTRRSRGHPSTPRLPGPLRSQTLLLSIGRSISGSSSWTAKVTGRTASAVRKVRTGSPPSMGSRLRSFGLRASFGSGHWLHCGSRSRSSGGDSGRSRLRSEEKKELRWLLIPVLAVCG
eukprot:13909019-Heterocapsa_arctica.AAC.1